MADKALRNLWDLPVGCSSCYRVQRTLRPIYKTQMNYPDLYTRFKRASDSGTSANIRFQESAEEVFRFCNRFRLAKSFERIEAKGYTTQTISGYSGLMRVFLSYSAFELFLKICGLNLKAAESLCAKHDADERMDVLRQVPNSAMYFFQISTFVTGAALRKSLQDFHEDQSVTIVSLARGIRHIFAHGHLASGSAHIKPGQVVTICNIIADFLLLVMNEEFKQRVAQSGA